MSAELIAALKESRADRLETALHRSIAASVALGLLLLPFSTPSASTLGDGVTAVAIAYGLPFLALAALGIAGGILGGWIRVSRRTSWTLFFCAVHVAAIVWFAGYAGPGRMIARSSGAVLGFALFLYLISVTDTRGTPTPWYERFLSLVVLSGGVLGAYYIVNFVVRAGQYGVGPVLASRVIGGLAALPWNASNVVAGAMLTPFCLSFLVSPRTARVDAALRAAVGLMAGGILLTMSLGAIATAAGFLVIAMPRGSRLKTFTGLVVLVVIAVGALRLWLGAEFATLLGLAFDLGSSAGGLDRVELFFKPAFRIIASHPLSPVGYGNTPLVLPGGAHNIWLAYMIEMGVVGVVSWAAVFGALGWRALRLMGRGEGRRRREGWLYLCWLAAIFTHMMVETPIYTQQAAVYFWAGAGLLVAASGRGDASAVRDA
jgi:O-antigen ligase